MGVQEVKAQHADVAGRFERIGRLSGHFSTARGQTRANNVGWRLDYRLATPGIAAKARRESIYLDQHFSDHAPVTVDYDFKL
jgi:exonuclease III